MPNLIRRIFFAVLLMFLYSCSKVELYTQIPENDANSMIEILLSYDISSEKTTEKGLSAIYVEKGKIAEAIRVLKYNGWPRESFKTMTDIFGTDSLVSSPTQEKVRLTYAISQSLSETIANIDGVITARVHVVLGGKKISKQESEKSSVAIFIKHRSDFDLTNIQHKIKTLATNSVPDLHYNRVSVILFPSTFRDRKILATNKFAEQSEQESNNESDNVVVQ